MTRGRDCGNQNIGVCGCRSVLRQRTVGSDNKSQAVRPGRVPSHRVVSTPRPTIPPPIANLEDNQMPSVCALRDKLILIVVASCAICLAPAGFARNTPRFDPIQCPDGFPQLTNVRCGHLVVPEDRSQPSGRTIQLFVAIIPAQSGKSAPDPIVYLGTGPGGIAIVEAALLIDTGVYLNRDLVVMAQRGQFLSIPGPDMRSHRRFQPATSQPSLLFRSDQA